MQAPSAPAGRREGCIQNRPRCAIRSKLTASRSAVADSPATSVPAMATCAELHKPRMHHLHASRTMHRRRPAEQSRIHTPRKRVSERQSKRSRLRCRRGRKTIEPRAPRSNASSRTSMRRNDEKVGGARVRGSDQRRRTSSMHAAYWRLARPQASACSAASRELAEVAQSPCPPGSADTRPSRPRRDTNGERAARCTCRATWSPWETVARLRARSPRRLARLAKRALRNGTRSHGPAGDQSAYSESPSP